MQKVIYPRGTAQIHKTKCRSLQEPGVDKSDYSQQANYAEDTQCIQSVLQLERNGSGGAVGANARPGSQAVGHFDLMAQKRKITQRLSKLRQP